MNTGTFHSDLKVELGRGTFGIVYKGHRKNQEAVAVKRILNNIPGDSHCDEKTQIELDILQRVSNHPNMVKLFDFHKDNDFTYIIMEHCDLGDLGMYITGKKPDWDVKLHIMSQCASALEYMHTLKPSLVHRDIKLSNILMKKSHEKYDCVKVADFGMTKVFDTQVKQYMSTAVVGTPAYNAPELFAAGRKQYTTSVDVFSLGLVFLVVLNHRYCTDSLEPIPSKYKHLSKS